MVFFRYILGVLMVSAMIVGCTAVDEIDRDKAPLVLHPASFGDMPGWADDDHGAVMTAFLRSCERILRRSPADRFGPDGIGGTYGDWHDLCRAAQTTDPAQARQFFESAFRPHLATFDGKEEKGLFTGYYEAALNGSLTRRDAYQYPLHKRPDDLVMVDLGEFRDSLRGQRVAGRVTDGRLRPYEDRAAIIGGNWPHDDDDHVLVWTDDPIGAFFLQIQGSGRITLDDGDVMRVGYAGQNGHVYYAIGRALVQRGYLAQEDVSMQSIRAWLEDHPDQADEIMNTNPSYVFFRALDGAGPVGGEGLPLTPGRSLAIDRSRMPYGLPVWVDIAHPLAEEPPIRRLMVAQDTGGAIRGAVRGDFFWGHGAEAEDLAGRMRSQGRYWLLLPAHL